MKEIRHLILAVTIGLTVCIGLSGCGSAAEAKRVAVAIGLDKQANSQLADGVMPCVQDAMGSILQDGGSYIVALSSSKPEVVCSADVTWPRSASDKTTLESRWEKDRDGYFTELKEIDKRVPSHEETNPLETLRILAEGLRSGDAGNCDEQRVILATSGLITSGPLDMTGRGPYGYVLEKDFGELVEQVKRDTSSAVSEHEVFPDLKGIHVTMMGVGRLCAGAQADLAPEKVALLKEFWATVLAACDADFDPSVDFTSCPTETSGSANREDYPVVTPVTFQDAPITAMVSFDDHIIQFEPNSDIYTAESAARAKAVIAPYAESIMKTGQQIILLGTTAYGDLTECINLGARRAGHVKQDMVDLGVPDGQVIVCSAGCEGTGVHVGDQVVDFYQVDHEGEGPDYTSWNEEVAKSNRAVHLIPREQGQEVIERFAVA